MDSRSLPSGVQGPLESNRWGHAWKEGWHEVRICIRSQVVESNVTKTVGSVVGAGGHWLGQVKDPLRYQNPPPDGAHCSINLVTKWPMTL